MKASAMSRTSTTPNVSLGAPGIVEELPASAYPEPVTRGLYGGPLWLDMQGLQWPYTPRTGIGISGYGWLDNNYRYTRIGDPNQSPHYTWLLQQGRFLLRVTPTYTNGTWFVQAQAEIVANKDQNEVQPAPGVPRSTAPVTVVPLVSQMTMLPSAVGQSAGAWWKSAGV